LGFYCKELSMAWFKNRRLGYVALILSVLALPITGFAVVLASQPNQDIATKIQAAVDAGEITQEEADAKHLEIRERLAEGGKRVAKRGHRKRITPEDIAAKIQAAVDAGEITQKDIPVL
jgi:hypothetical protein